MKQKFQKLKKLGQGTYGTVYLAKIRSNSHFVAIKKIKIEPEDQGLPSTALREIAILKSINHFNIVNLIQVIYIPQQKKLYLIFQYIEQDLYIHITKHPKLSLNLLKSYLYQILIGLNYLHQNRIIHRDLKPQNILINKQGIIKIADFGLSRVFGLPLKTYTKQIQTLWYRAPELLLGCHKYDLSVDIWSVGCIFFQLAQNQVLFEGNYQIQQIHLIFKYHGTPSCETFPQLQQYHFYRVIWIEQKNFPKFKKQKKLFKNLDDDGINLLNQMIAINPKNRITPAKALAHQYFTGMQFSGY